MFFRLVVFCLLLLSCSNCLGQQQVICGPNGSCAPQQQSFVNDYPAVVKVGCRKQLGRRIENSCGTGTIIGYNREVAYVLTCWHIFREGGQPFVCIGSKMYAAVIERQSKEDDLVLLRIANPKIVPIFVADKPADVGETVCTVGFAGNTNFRNISGSVLGFRGSRVLSVSGRIYDGMSGSALLNSKKELVAVCWGTNRGERACAPLSRVRSLLRGMFLLRRNPIPVQPTPNPIDLPIQPIPNPPAPDPPVVNPPAPDPPVVNPPAPNPPAPNPPAPDPPAPNPPIKPVPDPNMCKDMGIKIDRNTRELEILKKELERIGGNQNDIINSVKDVAVLQGRTAGDLESLKKEVGLQKGNLDQLIASQRETDIQIKDLVLLIQRVSEDIPKLATGVGTGKARFRVWIDDNKVVKVEPRE